MGNYNIATRMMSLGLFVLFVAALSISLVAGVRSYSSIVSINDDVKEHRIANGAITNTIHAMDSWDAVKSVNLNDGKALVIRENTINGVYENRLYKWKGNVILEFAPAYDPYIPSRGTKLITSNVFDFDIEGSLITITTDEGTTKVALESGIPGVSDL